VLEAAGWWCLYSGSPGKGERRRGESEARPARRS
jgi:hypothetical protein